MNNSAVVPVTGTESFGGYTQAVLRVYRNGTQVGPDQVQNLVYSGGVAPFSFSPTITAELAHYDVELLLQNNANQLISVQRTNDIVAGDVIVIQGQSNAIAKEITGSSAAYLNPFVRTIGLESFWPPASTAFGSWMIATGDGALNEEDPGVIGQWGLVMANQIATANNVPVAVINGGFGGSPITFFSRNDALHTDITTNYGRLLQRLQRGGLAGAVRTILFYQGESDDNDGPGWQAGYEALHADWLEDYPSIEKFYVFQVRECPCGPVSRFDVDLRNRQRLAVDQFLDVRVMSTNALDGHNGCHFSFSGGGYEDLGLNITRMVQHDLYGGPSVSDTDAPNPAYAVLASANHALLRIPLRNRTDAITFDAGAIADFELVGTSATIVSGTVANGILELTLSGDASGATAVVYTGHSGPASGNWVANANGIGLLSFLEFVQTDNTPPVITLLGSNPVLVNAGGTYVEPGATATDNLDGDLTSSIVIDASAVNTSIPGDYLVTYNVSDVAGNAATQVTRTVHVNGVPTANDQSVSTPEDTALPITLTASDTDGDTLTFSVVMGPAHGSLSGTAPNLTYTPAANYNGPDTFTFKVNDGTVDSNTATVSITVTPVNDPPVANPQSVTTPEDTATAITLTASDVDGDTLTYSVVAGPAHGVLSGTAPNLTYTPAANYNGPDSFTFKANDGTVDSNIATISITITPVNDAPVANAQSVTTNQNVAIPITLTATDVDGDTLTYSVVTGPTHGSLSGTAPNVTYTPASNYHGPDGFTFKANDGTVDSNTAMVSITVNGLPQIEVEQPVGVPLTDGASTIDFGYVTSGNNNSHTFTIQNTGSADLTGIAVSFDGANPADFTITGSPAITVVAGGSTTFTVQFSPGALTGRSANLHIASNDPNIASFGVTLTGTGVTHLQAWRLQYFGDIANSGNGADANDFDMDGLSNLLEFATASDPTVSSVAPGQLTLNGGTMEFVYTRSKGAMSDGFTFIVEWKDNLTDPNWSNTGVSEQVLDEDATLQHVQATVAIHGKHQFMRLRVAPPP
jgi:hypothetical protein